MKEKQTRGITGFFTQNRTSLFILSLIYLVGIGIGAWLPKGISAPESAQIYALFENYLFVLGGSPIGFWGMFTAYFQNGLVHITAVFVLGFLIIGTPFLFAGVLYKGICTGFSGACLLFIYGTAGPASLWVQVLWQNIFLMPCILLFAGQSMRFSRGIFHTIRRDKQQASFDLKRNVSIFALQYIGAVFSLFLISLMGAGGTVLFGG